MHTIFHIAKEKKLVNNISFPPINFYSFLGYKGEDSELLVISKYICKAVKLGLHQKMITPKTSNRYIMTKLMVRIIIFPKKLHRRCLARF